MQDKSINGAFLALREQIIREGSDGLNHVEALLTTGGVHMPAVLPAKSDNAAKRGHMRILILDALREGPQSYGAIVAKWLPEGQRSTIGRLVRAAGSALRR